MKPMRLFAVSDKFKPWGMFVLVYFLATGVGYDLEELINRLYGTNRFIDLIFFLTMASAVIPLFFALCKKLPDLRNALHFSPVKAIMGVASMGVLLFIDFVTSPDAFTSSPGSLTNTSLSTFMIALALPVLEEMFFRGILLALFIKYYGKCLGMIFSSVCFCLAHVAPVPGFLWFQLATFSGGLIMAYATIKTKNLSYAMGFHVAWNIGFLLGL